MSSFCQFLVLVCSVLICVGSPSLAQTADQIRSVQQSLADYGVTQATGRVDEVTRVAIKAYQRDWHLEENGEVNAELISRLARTHTATKPQWTTTANQDCKVWNARPAAQELIVWDGPCLKGIASGRGQLKLTWQLRGRRLAITFDGEYRDGRANGLGTIVYANGDRFAGRFENGRRHGEGVFAWVGGTHYKGQFENGLRHGKGKVVFLNGDSYDGEWQSGKPHGTGTYTTAVGSTEKREWRNGCSMLNGNLRWLFVHRESCGS